MPIIIKALGGKTNQNDQQPIGRKKQAPPPQEDLEDEIAEFLRRAQQQNPQANSSYEADVVSYAEEDDPDEYIAAETIPAFPTSKLSEKESQNKDLQFPGQEADDSLFSETPLFAAEQAFDDMGVAASEAAYARTDMDTINEANYGSNEGGKQEPLTVSQESIISMFQNPNDLRNVIIMNEVLNRPFKK